MRPTKKSSIATFIFLAVCWLIFYWQFMLHSTMITQSDVMNSMSLSSSSLSSSILIPERIPIPTHDDNHDNNKEEEEGIISQAMNVSLVKNNTTNNKMTTTRSTIQNGTTTEAAEVIDGNASSPSTLPAESSRTPMERPCRVIIENPIDYHHEVIESVVNRYPLPWHKFNCSINYPIIYDFSLFQNRFPNRVPFYIGKKPKYLNQTEFWGWKVYFEKNLQYRNITRSERWWSSENGVESSSGSGGGTVAYYRNLISNEEYKNGFMEADAIIDVSCGIDLKFMDALKQHSNRYCVLHNEVVGLEEVVKNKTCWVSPMYPPDYCTFLPIDLPKLEDSTTVALHDDSNETVCNNSTSSATNNRTRKPIRVCAVGGGGRDHSKIVRLFSKVPYRQHNATLIFSARRIKEKARNVVSQLGMEGHVQFTYVKDYLEFAKFVSTCDIYLPCTDPRERKSHFPWGTKHLTGSIPQIIAYNLSSVMHSDLEAIYHDYLTAAPVEVYNNKTGSDAEALKRMIWRIANRTSSSVVNCTTK